MEKKNTNFLEKNTILILTVAGLMIFIRYILRDTEYLLYIVAIINIISIEFIVGTIIERSVYEIENKIDCSGVPIMIRNRAKNTTRKLWILYIILSIFFIVIYLKNCSSNTVNDIVAIIALCLSILDSEFILLILNRFKITN